MTGFSLFGVSGGPRARFGRAGAAVCLAAALSVSAAGCGDEDGDDGASPGGSAPTATAPSTPATTASSPGLTEDQAERKALVPAAKTGFAEAAGTAVAEVPGGRLASIELKGPAGSPQWHAEVAAPDGTVHTVRVDAVSGTSAGSAVGPDQDADDKREVNARLDAAKLSFQQAADRATARTKGTVTAVEIDGTDAGTVIWSVDVVTTDDWNKTTYDLDAATGDVLREDVDRD